MKESGYVITRACVGCGSCASTCPRKAIKGAGAPYSIREDLCIRCGKCKETCPVLAIIKIV